MQREPEPRAGPGLFVAAESLGFDFVDGVLQCVYLESLDQGVAKRMVLPKPQNAGLMSMGAWPSPSVYYRVEKGVNGFLRGVSGAARGASKSNEEAGAI